MANATAHKGVVISPVNMENRKDLGIRVGDTVRVWQKIEEKGKTRLQAFEGLVLARKHGNEPGATFTVRRVSGGVGIEKIFPLYSPMIDKIEIVRRSKVRRAKLYHIREKVAREIKRQMRKMQLVNLASSSDTEDKAQAEEAEKKAEEAASQEVEDKKEEVQDSSVENTENSQEKEESVEEQKEEKAEEVEEKKKTE